MHKQILKYTQILAVKNQAKTYCKINWQNRLQKSKTDKMLASAYNTQNNNLHQNVGAPCKMSAPIEKCRRS